MFPSTWSTVGREATSGGIAPCNRCGFGGRKQTFPSDKAPTRLLGFPLAPILTFPGRYRPLGPQGKPNPVERCVEATPSFVTTAIPHVAVVSCSRGNTRSDGVAGGARNRGSLFVWTSKLVLSHSPHLCQVTVAGSLVHSKKNGQGCTSLNFFLAICRLTRFVRFAADIDTPQKEATIFAAVDSALQ